MSFGEDSTLLRPVLQIAIVRGEFKGCDSRRIKDIDDVDMHNNINTTYIDNKQYLPLH